MTKPMRFFSFYQQRQLSGHVIYDNVTCCTSQVTYFEDGTNQNKQGLWTTGPTRQTCRDAPSLSAAWSRRARDDGEKEEEEKWLRREAWWCRSGHRWPRRRPCVRSRSRRPAIRTCARPCTKSISLRCCGRCALSWTRRASCCRSLPSERTRPRRRAPWDAKGAGTFSG